VLLSQDGGGHQDGNLLAIHDGFECRAQGYLRLAIAHVATDEAIHGARELHVGLDLFQGADLGLGFDVGEGRFQLGLPQGVHTKRVTGYDLTGGIEDQ
jgi:hypothetical protein